MTQTSAFHFESLVWDWPIAIYLFLIGISAGLVTLAVLLRRVYPQAGGADSTLLRTTLIVGPGAVILGLLILVFHLTRPWTFWKLMFHYSFTSVMSMGVMLFQLYMVVLAWCRRAGADCANVAQTVGQSQFRHSCRAGGMWGQPGRRVDAALFHSLRRAVNGGVSQNRGGFWTYSFLKSVFWRCC